MFNFREIFKRTFKIYGIWPQAHKFVTNTLPQCGPNEVINGAIMSTHLYFIGWLPQPIRCELSLPSQELLLGWHKTRKWSNHMIWSLPRFTPLEKVSVRHISGFKRKLGYLYNSGIHSALLIKFLEGGSHLIGWDSYPMKWGSDHKVKRSHRQLMCTQCLPRRWTKLTSDWSMYSSVVHVFV